MPPGHGFCLYLRNALDLVGLLDPVFGPGYNEENDWVMRAQAMGFVAKRANHAFVYHLGSQSFGGKRLELEERNARILAETAPALPSSGRASMICWTHASRPMLCGSRPTGKIRVALDLRHLPPDQVGGDAYPGAGPGQPQEIELTLVVCQPGRSMGSPAQCHR